MGNIQTLTRNGFQDNGTFTNMDVLAYTYDNGNKLLRVADSGNDYHGFIDDAKNTADNTNDYTYDVNGNLLSDTNKGITSISYSHFDLPTEVVFDNNPNKKVSYIYGADMTRLKKVITDGGTTNTVDYAGKFIYENNNLQFMSHAGGYTVSNGNNWDYIYQFKDNLGNIRLSYSDINKDGSVDSSEIMHERNPYPFGMVHKGYNGGIQGAENNYMEFQGQELDKSLDLNWHHFKYRTYDRALGRFLQIDPLATTYEHNSTYAFAENNVTSGIDLEGKELSFEHDGNRATAVFGPRVNALTLQEVSSQVSQKKTERDAFINKITPKYDVAQTSAGTINYPSTHISRVAAAYPQSGYRLAETVGVAAQEAATDFFGGALIVGGIRALRGAGSVWNLGRFARGNAIHGRLGANVDWPSNFPTIDKIINRIDGDVATSIKSLDLTAPTYNQGNKLYDKLKGYIDKLDDFTGAARTNRRTGELFDIRQGRDFTSKSLELGLETGQGTTEQWSQINKAIQYALDRDINFSIRFVE